MIGSLQRFVDELRGRGIAVSPAEAIDAARAVAALGPEDRSRFRSALAVTLAKDLRSLVILEETFEGFFASPARGGRGRGKGESGAGGGSGGRGRGAGGRVRVGPSDETAEPGRRGTRTRTSSPQRERTGLRALGTAEIRRALGEARAREEMSKKGLAPEARRSEQARGEAVKRRGEAADAGREAAARASIVDREARTMRGASSPSSPERPRRNELGPDARAGAISSRNAERIRLRRLVAAETEAGDRPADPRRLDLAAPMASAEEARLAREIPRIIEEIRLRLSRRQRRAARGRLWMKRAIRENLLTGGVPFRLPMRAPRKKDPRIVLVVDASRSVARAAGFFLLLALECLRTTRRARVFLFVDHPLDATEPLTRWVRGREGGRRGSLRRGARSPLDRRPSAEAPVPTEPRGSRAVVPISPPITRADRPMRSAPDLRRVPPHVEPAWSPYAARAAPGGAGRGRAVAAGVVPSSGGRSFHELLLSIPGLDPDAPSDYGRTFYALASGPLRTLGKDAVLVILGDGRTNRFDPLPWAFDEIASRARRVLWLVPEPRVRWGSGDSAVLRYLPACDVAVEARDLEGLAHGVREALVSL